MILGTTSYWEAITYCLTLELFKGIFEGYIRLLLEKIKSFFSIFEIKLATQSYNVKRILLGILLPTH